MSKLGELLKACLDRNMSYEKIMEYAARLGNGSREERIANAEKLIAEIEAEELEEDTP